MRVLVVSNTFPPADISGVGSLAQELLEELGPGGELEVLTRVAPRLPGVHTTGGPKLLFPLLAGFRLPPGPEPEVIHVNESDGVMVALRLALGRLLGRRGPRLSVTFQVSYRTEAREVRPIVVDGRELSRPSLSERVFKYLRAPLLEAAGRLTARLAHGVVACSHYTAGELERDYGVPSKRIEVIPNGLRVGPEPVRQVAAAAPAWALFAGRLRTRKAVAVLLEALARPETGTLCLRIVGDGEQRGALEAHVRRLGLAERVEFLGRMSREQLEQEYRRADLFVLPSTYEGFPVAILEAMAAGLPVVVTAVAGVPEAVQHGVSGLLVPPEDVAALAVALGQLAADTGRRAAMGKAARKAVAERFGIEQVSERYMEFWRRLAAPAGTASG